MKLIEKLDNYFDVENPDAASDEFFNDWVEEQTEDDLKAIGITYKLVDSFGGEGMGDDFWSVYKFTDTETNESVYIQFGGSYASYRGPEYNDLFVVEPKQVTVTQWEIV